MRIKEPKKIIALFFIVYIVFATTTVVKDIMERTSEPQKEITGLASNGVVSINLIQVCNIQLQEGYNFISLCANTSNMSILKILEPLQGQYEFVLRWNAASQDFDAFSPQAASNSFTEFESNQSYFIYMDQSDTLDVSGTEFGDMNISLIQQFNSPSYPYQFTANVSKYITPIQNYVSFVLAWNVSGQNFITYSPQAAQQEFDTIDKGEGQMIYITSPSAVLSYQKSALQ